LVRGHFDDNRVLVLAVILRLREYRLHGRNAENDKQNQRNDRPYDFQFMIPLDLDGDTVIPRTAAETEQHVDRDQEHDDDDQRHDRDRNLHEIKLLFGHCTLRIQRRQIRASACRQEQRGSRKQSRQAQPLKPPFLHTQINPASSVFTVACLGAAGGKLRVSRRSVTFRTDIL